MRSWHVDQIRTTGRLTVLQSTGSPESTQLAVLRRPNQRGAFVDVGVPSRRQRRCRRKACAPDWAMRGGTVWEVAEPPHGLLRA